MRAFRCRVCDQPLFFENSQCVSCGTELAYAREERAIVPIEGSGGFRCPSFALSGCTWLTPAADVPCFACSLTRTRPNDADLEGLAQFPVAERAKRHLVVEMEALGFRVDGLRFDLLSSVDENVVIGHADGVITIDLAESDDAHRERVRAELGEPYRTMLGHFRHEVGHFVQWQLVRDDDLVAQCRALFGDERADYQVAIDRHYAEGPPADWAASYLSTYATMHPFEDFAETFAHYLHICDTIETAGAYGLTAVAPVAAFSSFRDLVTGVWVPLSLALNMVNRSMGKDDLYPFVIPGPSLDKLDFVARLGWRP